MCYPQTQQPVFCIGEQYSCIGGKGGYTVNNALRACAAEFILRGFFQQDVILPVNPVGMISKNTFRAVFFFDDAIGFDGTVHALF